MIRHLGPSVALGAVLWAVIILGWSWLESDVVAGALISALWITTVYVFLTVLDAVSRRVQD